MKTVRWSVIPFLTCSLLCPTRHRNRSSCAIDDVLTNPGMGITTLNRFNGQALNPLLEWSEVGPVPKLPQSAIKPDFPDTTTAYLRWYWNALEPEQGKFRWDIIDLALQEARAHGQTLAIRLMPYSNKNHFPSGIRNPGAAGQQAEPQGR